MSDNTAPQAPTPDLISLPPGMETLKGRDRLAFIPPLLAMNNDPVPMADVRIQSTENDNGSTSYCMVTLSSKQFSKLDQSVFEDEDLKVSVVIEVPHLNGGYKKKTELSGDFVSALLAQAKR